MEMKSILDSIREKKINELDKYGYIKSGHNGPYYDTETPVRNTAHFATTFCYYYQLTKENKYFDAIKKCGDYLVSREARPMDTTFFCRSNKHKDLSNGIIGAAWAIEGLVSAYKIINDKRYIEVAKKVFLLFPFDERYNLWKVIDIDGNIRGFDTTFNHQLWFAAAGTIILSVIDDKKIRRRCDLFFNNISRIFSTYSSGLIKHSILTQETGMERVKNCLNQITQTYNKITFGKSMQYKENGYHLFNLYAFALIKDHGYAIDLFKNTMFKKSLDYAFSNELYNWLERKNNKSDINIMPQIKNRTINIYGYSYNAPGFELPYITKVFQDNLIDKRTFVESVVQKQIDLTFDKDRISFCRNTEDENTLDSRIYELIRSLHI